MPRANDPAKPLPPRFNLQQRWPEAERAWLKERAAELMVSETNLLLALLRREGLALRGEDRPLDDFFPPASPRSKRAKAARQARRAERSSEADAGLPAPAGGESPG